MDGNLEPKSLKWYVQKATSYGSDGSPHPYYAVMASPDGDADWDDDSIQTIIDDGVMDFETATRIVQAVNALEDIKKILRTCQETADA